MSIDKSAQKRSIRDRVSETFDLGTRTLSLFDRQFKDYMDTLRSADDFARKEALNLKPLLKTAKTLVAGDDFIAAALKLSEFYSILEEITNQFDKLTMTLTDERHKLLVSHFNSDEKKQLLDYLRKTKKKSKTASEQHALIKHADVLNWFAGKFNARRRALRSLEKRVPQLKELRKTTKDQTAHAEVLFESLVKNFSALSKARAKGDIASYHSALSIMKASITPVMERFNTWYDDTVEPLASFLEKELGSHELLQEKPKEIASTNPYYDKDSGTKVPAVEEARPELKMPEYQGPSVQGTQHPTSGNEFNPSTEKTHSLEDLQKMYPSTSPPSTGNYRNPYVFENTPSAAPAPSYETPVAETPVHVEVSPGSTPGSKPQMQLQKVRRPQPAPQPQPKPQFPQRGGPPVSPIDGKPLPLVPPGRVRGAADHRIFIEKLAQTSSDPTVMAQEILTYSESLEDSDPEASLRLLAIAEGLISA